MTVAVTAAGILPEVVAVMAMMVGGACCSKASSQMAAMTLT